MSLCEIEAYYLVHDRRLHRLSRGGSVGQLSLYMGAWIQCLSAGHSTGRWGPVSEHADKVLPSKNAFSEAEQPNGPRRSQSDYASRAQDITAVLALGLQVLWD